MPIRNILVPICPEVAFDRQLDAALSLASQLEAHVNALYIRPSSIRHDASRVQTIVPGAIIDCKPDREDEENAHAKFETWRADHQLACGIVDQSLRTPFACWSQHAGTVETVIAQRGRLSDLIVLNLPDAQQIATEQAFDSAVFDTARPTILLPKIIPDDLLHHIVIAWNGSLQATRAVASAMPLLHEAEHVSIFTAPHHTKNSFSDLDLTDLLSWHGIQADCYLPNQDEQLAGTTLLRIGKDIKATMIVMGGYTHSRVRQMHLGGVTSHVLHHTEIPVLMMH